MYGASDRNSKYYAALEESGASWIRTPVGWELVEPNNVSPEQYNWNQADQIIKAALEGCFNLVVTLATSPAWASTSAEGPIDKVELSEFTQYVGALVERYDGDYFNDAPGSPVVYYWEFYNEPDKASTVPLFDGWGNHGAKYQQMLAAVYPVVKAANPDAQVVFGGIAYDNFQEDGGPFVLAFLDDVLQAGAGAYFDIMNFHFYPSFGSNWTNFPITWANGLREKTEAIRNKLSEYGIAKPIIITEAGWHSNPAPELPSSETTQSHQVAEIFIQSISLDIKFLIWFSFFDPGGGYPFDNGLVTNDSPPAKKRAFFVFQVLTQEFDTARFERKLPDSETGSHLLEVYQFQDDLKQRKVYAAWLNPIDTNATKPLQLLTAQATVYDVLWNPTLVKDVDDGKVDGKIKVQVNGQPIYIVVGQ
jgi:hypothetical protein